MSTHTKGPWKIFEGGNFIEVWAAEGLVGDGDRPNRFLVADVNFRQSDMGEKTPEQSVVNARLIAAAPEMLEALKGIVDEMELADFDPEDTDTWYGLAIEIIRKAEGK